MASGHLLGGTGLSNPMKAFAGFEPFALRGRRVAGGYRASVSGRLPFVSNIEDGHLFASIFAIEDTNERYAMAVFAAGSDGASSLTTRTSSRLKAPPRFQCLIRDAFVPDDDVLSDDAAPFVQRIRKGFVLLQARHGHSASRAALRN